MGIVLVGDGYGNRVAVGAVLLKVVRTRMEFRK